MTMPNEAPRSPQPDAAFEATLDRPGAYLRLGAASGLLTGILVLLVLAIRRQTSGLLFLPVETLWREPLAAVVFLVGVAALFSIGRRLLPRLLRWRTLAWLCLFLGIFSTLLLLPRLHWAAAAALSGGIAYQAMRWSLGRLPAVDRVTRAVLLPGLTAILLVALAIPAQRAWRDHRALQPYHGDEPNVLLIFMDTVRAWNLSAHGYARPTTPVLSEVAERGVLFTRAMSTSSWTLPSHASVFTGRWAHELSADWKWPLDATHPTLAEALRARGYLTAGFCANVTYCGFDTGLARGFDHYEDYQVPLRDVLNTGPLVRLASRIKWLFVPPPNEDMEGKSRTAPLIAAAFLGWLDRVRDAGTGQPFFAFLNFFDAHRPYTSPAAFQTRFTSPGTPMMPNLLPRSGPRRAWDPVAIRGSMDAYDASIAYLDSELGRLLESLDQHGVLENTIIVITSDHGEEFAEHGMIGHANGLYRASVMVPLMIIAPGRVPSGRRVGAAVSNRDVPRTLLELIDPDAAGTFPGHSLARLWQDSAIAPPAVEPVLSSLRHGPGLPAWYPVSNGPVRSVVDGPWRLIVQADGTEELFDFDRDSLEQENLITTEEGRAVGPRLRALLDSLTAAGPGNQP